MTLQFTRRALAGAVVLGGLTETGLAQRAIRVPPRSGTVWLNANEYPGGPPPEVVAAMANVLGQSNRYHYEEFDAFFSTLAASVHLRPENILVGAGSTEVLHCAVEALASNKRPFITGWPTFEAGPELAVAKGFPVVKVDLTSDYSSDVERLTFEARRARGGLIYVCNPNNPTSSITASQEMRWLVEHLPQDTHLVVDEAYIHFAETPRIETALNFVHESRNVVVLRTFSKIYGMAGVRVGFAVSRPDIIFRMTPYRNNVVSIMALRGVLAALELGSKLLQSRREDLSRTRSRFTAWCYSKGIRYVEPHANFVMIETKRHSEDVVQALIARGVAPGRPFPPYDSMLRITIGTNEEMLAFKNAFSDVIGIDPG